MWEVEYFEGFDSREMKMISGFVTLIHSGQVIEPSQSSSCLFQTAINDQHIDSIPMCQLADMGHVGLLLHGNMLSSAFRFLHGRVLFVMTKKSLPWHKLRRGDHDYFLHGALP